MLGPLHLDDKFHSDLLSGRDFHSPDQHNKSWRRSFRRSNMTLPSIVAILLLSLVSFATTVNSFTPSSPRHTLRAVSVGSSVTRYHRRHSCSSARRSNEDNDEEEEEEDPIFNDSLIYGMPRQVDFGLDYGRPKPHANGVEVDSNMELLRHRISMMLVGETLEKQIARPPRQDLGPVDFVKEVLSALLEPDDPLPDSGLGVLFHSSTRRWRMLLRESVGAPREADSGIVARALANAISRERNQFGILVGADDAEEYVVTFPGEVFDFKDRFCFVECHLCDAKDDSLLVAMGWQLKRRSLDGSWLIDRIDWQDFRNSYRPGIGREEWLRSVG